jgi:hypothetical protein
VVEVGETAQGLSISPDGHSLLYSQIDKRRSDLMLVGNFRSVAGRADDEGDRLPHCAGYLYIRYFARTGRKVRSSSSIF